MLRGENVGRKLLKDKALMRETDRQRGYPYKLSSLASVETTEARNQ